MASRVAVKSIGEYQTRHPLKILAGVGLCLIASYLMICLFSYNPLDPSLNGATSTNVTNAGGYTGALVADLILQIMGMGSALLVLMPVAWGIKMMYGSPIQYLWLRFCLMMVSIVFLSMLMAHMEPPVSWPIGSGLGGSIGVLLHDTFYRLMKNPLFLSALGVVTLTTSLLAFGMTWGEWRAMMRGLRNAIIIASGIIISLIPRRLGRSRYEEDEEDEYERPSLLERLQFWKRGEAYDEDDEEYDEDDGNAPPARRQQPRVSKKVAERGDRTSRPPARSQASLALAQGYYELPSSRLLTAAPRSKKANVSEAALTQNAKLLESVLQDFGVNGDIIEIRPGPVVTLYELEPSPGTKSSRVVGLSDDIARSMSAISARIAVIPGRNAIGIELPNSNRETVYLREMLENDTFESSDAKLPLALGKDIGGTPIIADLARMPHLLVAGTTGSGKSVAINTMILSLVYRLTPDECKFIMIDPKMLELSVYEGIPHLLSPVVTEPGKAVVALKWTVKEMENRYRLMSNLGVRNIEGYNKKIREAKAKGHELTRTVQTGFNPDTGEPIIEEVPLEMTDLPFIVVVVDEMADLMIVAGKDIESSIQRLAQMARAAGIHIIMATQRPSVDVITGVIKANFPTRISFQVTSRIDSRTILGEQGAEQLLGQGDMLYMAGGGRITRIHGPFVSDKEVEMVVEHLKEQGPPSYVDDVTRDEEAEKMFEDGGEKDELYDQAVAIVARDRKASTSYIQRCLKIGYNRAASIIEQMEREGVVGPANHVGKREVLVREMED
jgi:DNA segregation ATPase FtsK/SpoIIIE, S-DNA-T family